MSLLHRGIGLAARARGWLTLRRWRRTAASRLAEHSAERTEFEARMGMWWDGTLDTLDLLRLEALDAGNRCNQRLRPEAAASSDFTFEALAALHARACRITSEVLALLRTGHAEGAHARWRTLHEIAVTMAFIRHSSQAVAEAYLSHHLANHKQMTEYNQHAAALGYEPFSAAELDSAKARTAALCVRFGSKYAQQYGWAAAALPGKRPTFADIEAAVGQEKWRPWFRLASEGQHAGSHSLAFTLSLMGDHRLLLAGPSNSGVADPAMSSAIALTTATIVFVTYRPKLRELGDALALLRLCDYAQDIAFAEHTQLEEAEAERLRLEGPIQPGLGPYRPDGSASG